jgi:hypothetical protein
MRDGYLWAVARFSGFSEQSVLVGPMDNTKP